MTESVFIYDDFLSDLREELALEDEPEALLVHFFRKHIRELGRPGAHTFWDHRTISLEQIIGVQATGDLAATKRILERVSAEALAEVMEQYQPEEQLKCTLVQIAIWPEGIEQPPHLDHARMTTRYAGIVYLNDDFEGGETYFPEPPELIVRPKKGRLVLFDGANCLHGVTRVIGGTRFTMPMWFGVSSTSEEPKPE